MRRLLQIVLFSFVFVASMFVLKSSALAEPALCHLTTALSSGPVVACSNSLIQGELTRTGKDPNTVFGNPSDGKCFALISGAGTSISITPTSCAADPFNRSTTKEYTCADGTKVTTDLVTLPTNACRDKGGYIDPAAKCYEGVVVGGSNHYQEISCTFILKQALGLSDMVGTNCYGSDKTVDPPKTGQLSCSEMTQKVQTQPQGNAGQGQNATSKDCVMKNTSFFGFPTWYKYLPVGKNCSVKLELQTNPNQIWLVALAIADMALRLAGFVAVLFVINGGYKYITSQFDAEGTAKARDSILNALIGLVIAIIASALVNFVGRTLG